MSKGLAHPSNLEESCAQIVVCFNVAWIDYQGFVVMRNAREVVSSRVVFRSGSEWPEVSEGATFLFGLRFFLNQRLIGFHWFLNMAIATAKCFP